MKRNIVVLLVIALVIILVGCWQGANPVWMENPEEETIVDEVIYPIEILAIEIPVVEIVLEEEEPEPKPEPEEEEIFVENENLLTGLPDLSDEAIGKRPVAVMVSNLQMDLPQHGIGQADILFEIPLAGGLTRLMAVYGDYTRVPRIIPVRSVRLYFPPFALSFDSIFVYWGGDTSIIPAVEALGMEKFSGIFNTGGLFGRDAGRASAGFGLEHQAYFDGTRLVDTMQALGMRSEATENFARPAFLFHPPGELVAPEGEASNSIHINFGGVNATLVYDEDIHQYLKHMNGQPHVDGTTGETLSFTNVFVLETPIWINAIGHHEMNWAGGESYGGYYISNGVRQRITWRKEGGDVRSPLQFFDLEGNELRINRGKIYIAVNNPGQTTFEP